MRRASFPGPAIEGAIAIFAGTGLFFAVAGIESSLRASSSSSAFIEEIGKASTILTFGWIYRYLEAHEGAPKGKSPRGARLRRGATARGVSMGLAAAAVFAAVENLAYFAAFPEAGILARLLWSLPVHLDSALLEALGALPLLGISPRVSRSRKGALRGLAPRFASLAYHTLAFAVGLVAGALLHAAANLAAEMGIAAEALASGALVGIIGFAALAKAYYHTAYIGGFLHGAE